MHTCSTHALQQYTEHTARVLACYESLLVECGNRLANKQQYHSVWYATEHMARVLACYESLLVECGNRLANKQQYHSVWYATTSVCEVASPESKHSFVPNN